MQPQENSTYEYNRSVSVCFYRGIQIKKIKVFRYRIPGQFYVVFESPEDYRFSGGSGDYWEVYEAARSDPVQPSMEAPWREKSPLPQDRRGRRRRRRRRRGRRRNLQLQANATAAIGVLNSTDPAPPADGLPRRPEDPINYSGYYARSRCLLMTKSPPTITNVDAGLAPDSWPLVPHQYASLVGDRPVLRPHNEGEGPAERRIPRVPKVPPSSSPRASRSRTLGVRERRPDTPQRVR